MPTVAGVHSDLGPGAEAAVGTAPVQDCMACGFLVSDIRPGAAVALLRRIPERYRRLYLQAGASGEIDDLLHDRSTTAGWSAIEYGAHVAELLHSTSKRLVLVFDEGDREVSPPHLEAVTASARTASRHAVLASLSAAAEDLARVISRAGPDDWDRTAQRAGCRVTARQLLGEAEHEALHHLSDARLALELADSRRHRAAEPAGASAGGQPPPT
jgi:DinB superfamily